MAGSRRPIPTGAEQPSRLLDEATPPFALRLPGPVLPDAPPAPLPGPEWIDILLALPDGAGGRIERFPRQLRIARNRAPDNAALATEQRIEVTSAPQARMLTLELLAYPEAIARLVALRHGGDPLDLAEWLQAQLLAGALLLFLRPMPGRGAQPPKKPKGDGPAPPPKADDTTHWIEVVLLDERGKPVPNRACEIITPDKARHTGTTDKKGRVRLDGIPPGPCQVSFPELDDDEWKKG